jgi:hypothetical protein
VNWPNVVCHGGKLPEKLEIAEKSMEKTVKTR